MRRSPCVLAVGGSDPTAGAGIQADIRTIEAFGGQPASVVTALTVQTAARVATVHSVAPALIRDQLHAVLDSMAVDVVKVGMLPTAAAVSVVARVLDQYEVAVVVDPVLRATRGARLAGRGVGARLISELLPLATCVTANLDEAATLTGWTGSQLRTRQDMQAAARALVALGASAAIVKGGHLAGSADDVVWDGRRMRVLKGTRIPGAPMHGTGCAYASAVASALAWGDPIERAAARAKRHVRDLITGALETADGGSIRGPRPPQSR